MNTSSLLIGLGGLLIGSLGTIWYYQRQAAVVTAVTSVVQNVAPVITPEPVSAGELPPKADPPEATKEEKPPTPASDSATTTETASAESPPPTKQSEQRKVQKTNERLASLKQRLSLTDQQVETMRPLVSRMLAEPEASASKEQRAATQADQAAAEASLLSDLAPEQRTSYERWKAAEQANKIELAATQELSALVSQMSLNPLQKDRALEVFKKFAHKEAEADAPSLDAASIAERQAKRLAALKPILTPEQWALYERNPGGGSANAENFVLGGTDPSSTPTPQPQPQPGVAPAPARLLVEPLDNKTAPAPDAGQ